jgi:S-DNA-T family DNA segregation ATPase FtsK/SpoIIIE
MIKGDPNVANQAREILRLARAFERQGVLKAREIERLAEVVPFSSIRQTSGAAPVLGVWDETLEPIGFEPSGLFLVSGPPRSGKTTTTVSMLKSLDRVGHGGQRVLFAPARSDLLRTRDWDLAVSDPADIGAQATELAERLQRQDPELDKLTVVIQGLGEFVNGLADDGLNQILRACRSNDAFVIIEGEPIEFNGSYGLMGTVKLDRTGIVLQPDQLHGDTVLGTDFPRINRTEFPAGRGMYASAGRVYRVQVLDPSDHG